MLPDGLAIRSVTRADHPALVAALGQSDYFADRIGRARHGLGDVLVALVDGVPVGDVYLWCEQFEEPELVEIFPRAPLINHLEVAPEWQGRGIGTALVHAAEEAARARGYDIVVLGVGLDNPRAKELYQRLGYIQWHRDPIVTRWTEPDGKGGIRAVALEIDIMTRSLVAPSHDDWDAWHPRELAARLAGTEVPWHVAGGWALDLFRESIGLPQMRPHEDLEFVVPRASFAEITAYFADFTLFTIDSGALRPWHGTPVHPETHQCWVAEMSVPADHPGAAKRGTYRTDIFLEPGDEKTWVCRRNEAITQPLADVVGRTPDGIPFLKPQYVLLYKAKGMREKDVADFTTILPELSEPERTWLADALELAHPGHSWIDEVRLG